MGWGAVIFDKQLQYTANRGGGSALSCHGNVWVVFVFCLQASAPPHSCQPCYDVIVVNLLYREMLLIECIFATANRMS